MCLNIWNRPFDGIELGEDEVHLWRVSLNQVPTVISELSTLLTPDESRRAERYYRAVDRDHFIVARGALRKILSTYLSIPPHELRFDYNKYGKPTLSGGKNHDALNFNLSHSHDLALYAVTRGRNVGIDIEYIREDFATLEIAERFFSKNEVEMLKSLPSNQRTIGFFNCWSRKESFIKALGMGVSYPLDRFTVSLAPDDAPALLKVDDQGQEPLNWIMYELMAGSEYAAAVIVENPPVVLKQWQWNA